MGYIIYGLFIVTFGVLFLIKTILYRNKIAPYYKNNGITIINQQGFLKLQYYFGIVVSIYLIMFGIVNTIYRIRISVFVIGALVFYYLNSRLKVVGTNKGYINYN